MTKKTVSWTPYGLEAIRIAHLRRRRLLGALIALALAGAWMFMFSTGIDKQLDISTDGGGGSEVKLDVSGLEPKENKPLTISVDPGRVTRAETGGGGTPDSQITRFDTPTFGRANAYNWNAYALVYGPYVLIAIALYALAKRKARDEVNYGIYKGAMPYEMLTAAASRHVRTTSEARESLFGKRRVDYLPAEIVVERMPRTEEP